MKCVLLNAILINVIHSGNTKHTVH